MEFTLKIEMDNSIFSDGNGHEVAQILKKIASDIEEEYLTDGEGEAVHDTNGNNVGEWNIEA